MLLTGAQQRVDPVGAQIAVYGQCIRTEGGALILPHHGGAQMCRCVCFHGSANVVPLAIGDDKHALKLCIANGSLQCLDAMMPIHFIVSSLGLDGGNNVADCINDLLVEPEDRPGCSLQTLPIHIHIGFLNVRGHIGKLRIQSHNGGVLHLPDFRNQSVK